MVAHGPITVSAGRLVRPGSASAACQPPDGHWRATKGALRPRPPARSDATPPRGPHFGADSHGSAEATTSSVTSAVSAPARSSTTARPRCSQSCTPHSPTGPYIIRAAPAGAKPDRTLLPSWQTESDSLLANSSRPSSREGQEKAQLFSGPICGAVSVQRCPASSAQAALSRLRQVAPRMPG
jgi:hypothetical protein